MKTLITSLVVFVASTQFAPKAEVEVQFLKGDSEPMGVILRTGVREFTDSNGQKAYWVTGKTLTEIQNQINNHK